MRGRRWRDAAAVVVPLAGPHRRRLSGTSGGIVASVPLFLLLLLSRRGVFSRRLGRWMRLSRRRLRQCRRRRLMRRWRRPMRQGHVVSGRCDVNGSKGRVNAATIVPRLRRLLPRLGLRGRPGRSPVVALAAVVADATDGVAVRRRAGGVRSMPPCPSVRLLARCLGRFCLRLPSVFF